ncbi:MAG: ArsR family transcriptional regulator [Sphingobium sp.]|nr:MAG: ArsR family transcriptional regulator [Sphingobium sp.]
MESPVSEDPLDLDRQVCFPLYAAWNLLGRLHRPLLAELGVTYPQYLVLLVLWRETPQTVGSLGDRLDLDSGTLTPLLKGMELAGLISRARDCGRGCRRVARSGPRTGRGLAGDAFRTKLIT